jgi:phage baseplate assembly protein gpV
VNGVTGVVLTVDSGSTCNASTFTISDGATSGSFVINGKFQTANLAGLSGSTTTAFNTTTNTPVVTINSGSTIEYNAASGTQTVTGRTDYSNLTLSVAGIKQLGAAATVAGTLNFSGGNFDLNAKTFTLASDVAQSITGVSGNTFSIVGAANSIIALSAATTTSHVVTLSNFGTATSANLITGANVNVQLNSNTQLDCAGNGASTSMLTVLGTLTMNSATSSNIANVHPPFYGTGSTLLYNANYSRFDEWNATTGPGFQIMLR